MLQFIWYLAPAEGDPLAFVSFHTFPPQMFCLVIEQLKYSWFNLLIRWKSVPLFRVDFPPYLLREPVPLMPQSIWQREIVGAFALWGNLVPSHHLCAANLVPGLSVLELWHQYYALSSVVIFFFFKLTQVWVAAEQGGSHVSMPIQYSFYLCCHLPTTKLLLDWFLLPLGRQMQW